MKKKLYSFNVSIESSIIQFFGTLIDDKLVDSNKEIIVLIICLMWLKMFMQLFCFYDM